MLWTFLDTGANSAAYNMSVDEDLLARAQAGEQTPVLRFYTWQPRAITIGRFQKIEKAVNHSACERLGIEIVRRVTGGRAVLHDQELTYSIVSRIDNPLFPQNILGTYKVIAEGLLAGFRNLGIPAEIVARGTRSAALVKKEPENTACFSSPSWYEIVVNGKKIAGNAQRRLSHAFLQHGSILIGFDPALEAEVIPGGGLEDKVTSIQQELGKDVSLDEVKLAFKKGFAESLGIAFR
jgi:lipoate-protein ligase A